MSLGGRARLELLSTVLFCPAGVVGKFFSWFKKKRKETEEVLRKASCVGPPEECGCVSVSNSSACLVHDNSSFKFSKELL